MENKIEMTAEQLASLDLLINKKELGALDYCDDVANNLVNGAHAAVGAAMGALIIGATPAAGATIAAGTLAAGTAIMTRAMGGERVAENVLLSDDLRAHLNEVGHNMPLETLLELRKISMLKK